LASFKLHTAAVHLPQQAHACGAVAHMLEFWVERMVQFLKTYVKYRSTDYPELIFVHWHLIWKALAHSRAEHPEDCRSFDELIPAVRHGPQLPPKYDVPADDSAEVLLGKAQPLTPEELGVVINLLAINHCTELPGQWTSERLASSRLQKFVKANLATDDGLASAQCESQGRKDNSWAYISILSAAGFRESCIARPRMFVQVLSEPAAVDGDQAFPAAGEQPDQLRLAVCDMWHCTAVTAAACDDTFDGAAGMPDILKVADSRALPSSPSYARLWLLELDQVTGQVLAVRPRSDGPLAASGRNTRLFLTSHKASGRS
jgi:hypothetical protein